MEMQPSPPLLGKRLWKIIRVVFYMMRKEVSKTKLYIDLPMVLKRSKSAGKAIGNLVLHHHNYPYTALGCRPDDIHKSYISPQLAYEYSCSDSPAYFPKRNKHNHQRNYQHGRRKYYSTSDGKKSSHKVFDVSRSYDDAVEGSPFSSLSGFGRSPMVRQLRVTDSPFSLRSFEEDHQVDKAAEDFIAKFYNELKQQRRTNILEPPSSYHKWMR